jgi:predicted DNA-binding transcriptional regulator AlpA
VEELLSQKQAARLLGLSVRTLERHRVWGTGPRFCRVGRLIRYRPCDIEAWIAQSLRASTAEGPRRAPESQSRQDLSHDK